MPSQFAVAVQRVEFSQRAEVNVSCLVNRWGTGPIFFDSKLPFEFAVGIDCVKVAIHRTHETVSVRTYGWDRVADLVVSRKLPLEPSAHRECVKIVVAGTNVYRAVFTKRWS